ncbi:hypothetical protein TEQG_06580 [Trichophyton equinum CBS 127.97]|uniref:Uncharacterized protein n=1 Tax=Trichophyton equinum (strain ATCC MYA-4606 / CBS 127.97) TaxID=559882 RepID=F2PZY5_TRIEC|nr:hypothetical protein TEQG_06580 [Trichophyton equinum CBS 127.97]
MATLSPTAQERLLAIDAPYLVTHQVQFPILRKVLTELIRGLAKSGPEGVNQIPYAALIVAFGGEDILVDEALSYIDPEIKAMENHPLSKMSLDRVRDLQGDIDWSPYSGYLSSITDSGCSTYWRAYVGQSNNPQRRIGEHIRAVLTGAQNTLHYYVFSCGEGRRALNFIRLWTIKRESFTDLDGIKSIIHNLLEMAMCRAFQSLPGTELDRYFSCPQEQGWQNLGLNIISPLLQGLYLSPNSRRDFILNLKDSRDPEIRRWPDVRCQQRRDTSAKTSINDNVPKLQPGNYREFLKDGLKKYGLDRLSFKPEQNIFSSVSFDIHQIMRSYTEQLSVNAKVPLAVPFGTLNARVGFVLDYSHMSVNISSENSFLDDTTTKIPWGLSKCGFTEKNSLIMTFNHQSHLHFCINAPIQRALPDQVLLDRLTKDIVQASNLRIVFLCGSNAESFLNLQTAETASRSSISGPFKIQFSKSGVAFYLEKTSLAIIRIFIIAPNFLTNLGTRYWRDGNKAAELLNFARYLTDTPGIRPYVYESYSAISNILRYAEKERSGDLITWDMMAPGVQEWLFRKGFKDVGELRDLERLAGSIPTALLMFLHVLQTAKINDGRADQNVLPRHPSRRDKATGRFDIENFHEVKLFCSKILARRESEEGSEEPGYLISRASDPLENYPSKGLTGAGHDNPTLQEMEEFVDEDNCNELEDLANLMSLRTDGTYEVELDVPLTKRLIYQTPSRLSWVHKSHDIFEELQSCGRVYEGSIDRKILCVDIGWMKICLHNPYFILYRQARIQIELLGPGERHKYAYAIQTKPHDDANRLAFRATCVSSDGEEIEEYPRSSGEKTAYKVDSLIDRIEGKSLQTIAQTKRR